MIAEYCGCRGVALRCGRATRRRPAAAVAAAAQQQRCKAMAATAAAAHHMADDLFSQARIAMGVVPAGKEAAAGGNGGSATSDGGGRCRACRTAGERGALPSHPLAACTSQQGGQAEGEGRRAAAPTHTQAAGCTASIAPFQARPSPRGKHPCACGPLLQPLGGCRLHGGGAGSPQPRRELPPLLPSVHALVCS